MTVSWPHLSVHHSYYSWLATLPAATISQTVERRLHLPYKQTEDCCIKLMREALPVENIIIQVSILVA